MNTWIDEPHKWLGKQHRKVRHDAATPFIAALKFGDPKAGVAAAQHILDDKAQTQIKKAVSKLLGISMFE